MIDNWQAKYRWEFMRRSPEYLEAWGKVKTLRRDAGFPKGAYGNHSKGVTLWDYHSTSQYKEEQIICSKFFAKHVGMFLDPRMSFDQVSEQDRHFLKMAATSDAVTFNFPELGNPGKVNIEIDFSRIGSIPALKDAIGDMIDKHVERHSVIALEKRNRTDFEIFIEAGRLKHEEGWTYRKIAARMFPRDFNPKNLKANPESAERKAKQYVETYHRLVNGGYKNLTFP